MSLRKKANYAELCFLLYGENCKAKVIVISLYFRQTSLHSIHPPEKNFTVESGCFPDAPKTSFTGIKNITVKIFPKHPVNIQSLKRPCLCILDALLVPFPAISKYRGIPTGICKIRSPQTFLTHCEDQKRQFDIDILRIRLPFRHTIKVLRPAS